MYVVELNSPKRTTASALGKTILPPPQLIITEHVMYMYIIHVFGLNIHKWHVNTHNKLVVHMYMYVTLNVTCAYTHLMLGCQVHLEMFQLIPQAMNGRLFGRNSCLTQVDCRL